MGGDNWRIYCIVSPGTVHARLYTYVSTIRRFDWFVNILTNHHLTSRHFVAALQFLLTKPSVGVWDRALAGRSVGAVPCSSLCLARRCLTGWYKWPPARAERGDMFLREGIPTSGGIPSSSTVIMQYMGSIRQISQCLSNPSVRIQQPAIPYPRHLAALSSNDGMFEDTCTRRG